jgi:hypothetical protein
VTNAMEAVGKHVHQEAALALPNVWQLAAGARGDVRFRVDIVEKLEN